MTPGGTPRAWHALPHPVERANGKGEALGELIGASTLMQRVYRTVRRVAGSRATVLLAGETGTGKGRLCACHSRSQPARGEALRVPAMWSARGVAPRERALRARARALHRRGKDSGRAVRASRRGALFLDEIGEIPALTQIKLLRVLQERTFERVGSNNSVTVDVRIIAATHRDLVADVQMGRFPRTCTTG